MGTHVQATLANVKEAKSAELGARTIMQLKAQCTQHGLRKTGTKAELVARLCDKLCTAEPLDVKQPTCNWTFGSCGVSIPATHHCSDCREYLCRVCFDQHTGGRWTQHHNIQTTETGRIDST